MPGFIRQHFRYTSWPIILAMIVLMAMGISAIRVAERADDRIAGYSMKQIHFACVALMFFVVATVVPYGHLGRWAYPLFAGTLAVLTLLFFLPENRNCHRWIDLKVMMVQPSEIAKLTYIVLLAWYLRTGDHYRRLTGLLIPFALTLVPMGLILKEPDLGTSLLFLPTLFFMLYMAGAKVRHLLGIIAVTAVLIFVPLPRKISPKWSPGEIADRKALAYWSSDTKIVSAAPLALMELHQLNRVDGWLRQDSNDVNMNKGYQLHQSKIILGSGAWTGRGDWNDKDRFFRILPEDQTDFIFSVVGGQWGFLGCLAVLFLYGVIFVFGVEIASITNDAFGRLLAVGVLALLFTQLVINIGMTMGLMPVTGMTLPLVSYGGSSLVINCAALGLLVNVGQRRPITLARRPFEYGERPEKPPAPFGPLGGDDGGFGLGGRGK